MYIISIISYKVNGEVLYFLVRVYFCRAENFEHRYEEFLPLLPPARREKAERLLKKKDKLLSLMSGLLLVKILGREACAQIKYNEHGKPYLEHGPCFSLSHSGNYAVIAVAENPIGVDVETVGDISDGIIYRCYTEKEQAFAALSTENALRIWTAKETVLKLLGTGFALSPKNFCVLPLEAEHKINGVNMRFFSKKLGDSPLTVAASGENEIEILELQPEDII